ncbi:MAG: hypothetical protein IPN09_08300 [Bacteroidetes bacterium]|jgi:hypothetical protein|nr:hypothetical protein [Bacteroidota bacterium]
MRKSFFLVWISVLILFSCKQFSTKQASASMKDGVDAVFGSGGTDTFKVGDLDNDGQPNLVFMKKPITEGFVDPDEGMTECSGGCNVIFTFDAKIPSFTHQTSIGGMVMDAGDLNEDGISELLYAPDWISSCWGSLFVYSLQDNKWIVAGSVAVYTCEENDYHKRLKKIDKEKFELVGQDWNEEQTELIDVKQVFSFSEKAI